MKKSVVLFLALCLTLGIWSSAQAQNRPCVFHKWGEWVTLGIAPCASDSTSVRKCTVCGETQVRNHAIADHVWGGWMDEVPSTCGSSGVSTRRCVNCGTAESVTIPPTGNHQWGWNVVSTLSCTTDGVQQRVCGVCGKTETTTVTAPGHDYGGWVTMEEPTCTEKGKRKRTCKTCGWADIRTIPAKGHPQTDAVLHQTCYKVIYGCPVCRQVIDEVQTGRDCAEKDAFLRVDPETGWYLFGCPVCGMVYEERNPEDPQQDWGDWVCVGTTPSKEHPRTDAVLHETCYKIVYGCPVCRTVSKEVETGRTCEVTDAFLGIDRIEGIVSLGCPICGTEYSTQVMIGLKSDDWTPWKANGNGTHSRMLKFVDSNFMETEACYEDASGEKCGVCGGAYIRSGICVALTDIPVFTIEPERFAEKDYVYTLLITIPKGATYTVLSNGDHATVEYEGVTGEIYSDYLNFVSVGE